MLAQIGSHVRGNIVGYLALFVALSGTALASGVLNKKKVNNIISNRAPGLSVAHAKSADSAAPSGNAGGDLAGSYPNPSLGSLPFARADRSSGTQTITTASVTDVTFPTELFDNAGMFDPASPDRMTAPRTGTYVIESNVRWDSNDTGARLARILVNANIVANQTIPAGAYGGENARENVTAVVRLNSGDVVKAQVFQNSGADRTLTANVEQTSFSVAFIGS